MEQLPPKRRSRTSEATLALARGLMLGTAPSSTKALEPQPSDPLRLPGAPHSSPMPVWMEEREHRLAFMTQATGEQRDSKSLAMQLWMSLVLAGRTSQQSARLKAMA